MNTFQQPDHRLELTPAEHAWVGFLRDICDGDVPRPTLRAVQALRLALWSSGHGNRTRKEQTE